MHVCVCVLGEVIRHATDSKAPVIVELHNECMQFFFLHFAMWKIATLLFLVTAVLEQIKQGKKSRHFCYHLVKLIVGLNVPNVLCCAVIHFRVHDTGFQTLKTLK